MSINTSSEELRKLLESDDYAPSPSYRRSSAAVSSELSSLLSSLNTDLGIPIDTPVKRPSASAGPAPLPAPGAGLEDEPDFTVVTFGTQCSLRSRLGRYLTASPGESPGRDGKTPSRTFLLGVEGQGTGDPLDSLVFINADRRDDGGPIRFGNVVAIKAPAAKERLLGSREGGKLGFWRNLVGQGEKWLVLKASARGVEEPASRGAFLRLGDPILLCTCQGNLSGRGAASEELLSLYEGAEGREPRMVHIDRAGLGDEVWHVDLFNSQPLPSWSGRTYLNGSFLTRHSSLRQPPSDAVTRTFPGVTPAPKSSLAGYASLPPELQQRVLVREVLLALNGVEGDVIRVAAPEPDPISSKLRKEVPLKNVTFVVNAELTGDRALASHVSTLLPMCEAAVRVRDFIRMQSRYEFGYVSQAACAGLKEIMKELDVLVAQLENQLLTSRLSIQRLIYLLQPSRSTLRVLDQLVSRIRNLSGGALLDELHALTDEQGDEKAKRLAAHLLHRAAEPFLRMLSLWLFRGELDDPYAEFLIEEDHSLSRDALAQDFNAQYWENRYTLRSTMIPRMLETMAGKALTAGKYLNVVRGLGDHSRGMELPPLPVIQMDLSGDQSKMFSTIEAAYAFSSRALLQILEDNYGLYVHLRSLRRFFLLENGDFFVQLMDSASEELRKDMREVSLTRMQTLLQQAVLSCTASTDPNRDDLTCFMAPHTLIQHLHLIQSAGEASADLISTSVGPMGLKGVESITLDYAVGWPVSLLLSRRAITKYQLLSRLLFFSKHVELRLLGVWSEHQHTKALHVRRGLGPSYCIRQRMLHFVQVFICLSSLFFVRSST